MSQFQTGLGAVHALAHPPGARYHKHHGLLDAILLPDVLAANRPAIEVQVARVARCLALGEPSFAGFMRWILELRQQPGIAHALGEIGLDLRDIDWAGEQALADIPSSDTNARPLSVDEYKEIYRNSVQGIV